MEGHAPSPSAQCHSQQSPLRRRGGTGTLMLQKKKTKLYHIDIEDAYHLAVTNSKFDYGVDDLNILVGNFVGNHKKLRNLSKMNFQSVKELLKSGSLL